MKFLTLSFGIVFLLLGTGCDLASESANDLIQQAQVAEATDSAPAPAAAAPASGSTAPSGATGTGAGGFLWKPTSESTGGLVVLLPGSTRGRTQGIATISGAFGTESAKMRGESHNGGRPHFYFSKPGAAYGSNITVMAPLSDGSVYSIVVPNGSQRFE